MKFSLDEIKSRTDPDLIAAADKPSDMIQKLAVKDCDALLILTELWLQTPRFWPRMGKAGSTLLILTMEHCGIRGQGVVMLDHFCKEKIENMVYLLIAVYIDIIAKENIFKEHNFDAIKSVITTYLKGL
jgi:hypothetical protein